MPDRIREINNRFIEKVGIETTGSAFAKSQIIVLDNKKDPYDVGIERADKFLLQKTDEVNDSIFAAEDAFNARIASGCRSDLFWRIVGIATVVIETNTPQGMTTCIYENYSLFCETLNGFGYNPIGNFTEENGATTGYDPEKLYILNQNTNPIPVAPREDRFNIQSLNWKGGLLPSTEDGQSYHTWMLDDEPYSEDLVNPIMATGIGTIALASNILTFDVLSNVDQQTPALAGIKTGALLTCDRFGIWFDEKTRIVSYGTTVVSIGTTTIAGTTLTNTARRTWVQTEDFSMRQVTTPEQDGTFTNFFVLQGPDDLNFDKFALKRTGEITDELSPEVPTRVCPMTESLVGTGVKIRYSNNGDPAKCEEWNKYLEGFPDPSDPVFIINPDSDGGRGSQYDFNIVEAPKNGPGKTWYRDGFTLRPIFPNGNPASYGDTYIITDVGRDCSGVIITPHPAMYANLPSCSPSLNDNIDDKLDEKNELEQQLFDDLENSQSDVAKLYRLTNALRSERNEINLRIWAYRVQMGRGEDNVDVWDERLDIINDPDFYGILQNPLSEIERFEFNQKNKRPNQ